MARTPGSASLVAVRGASWEQPFLYTEDDETTPIDLTGYSARMQVRTLAGQYGTTEETSLLLELTTDNGLLLIETPTGGSVPNQVRISASAEDHAALNPSNKRREVYAYGMELFIPGDDDTDEYVLPFLAGKLTVRGETAR